jgi:hypothetical protein
MEVSLDEIVDTVATHLAHKELAASWLALLKNELFDTPVQVTQQPFEHVMARVTIPLRALEMIWTRCLEASQQKNDSFLQNPVDAVKPVLELTTLYLLADELRAKFDFGEAVSSLFAPHSLCLIDLEVVGGKCILNVMRDNFKQLLTSVSKFETVFSVAFLGCPVLREQFVCVVNRVGLRSSIEAESSNGVKVYYAPLRLKYANMLECLDFEGKSAGANSVLRNREIQHKFPALAYAVCDVLVFDASFQDSDFAEALSMICASIEDTVTSATKPHIIIVWSCCPLDKLRSLKDWTERLMNRFDDSGSFRRCFKSVSCASIPEASLAPDAFHLSMLELLEMIMTITQSPNTNQCSHFSHLRLLELVASRMRSGKCSQLLHLQSRLFGAEEIVVPAAGYLLEFFHSLTGVPFHTARAATFEALARAFMFCNDQLRDDNVVEALWRLIELVQPCTAVKVIPIQGEPESVITCGRMLLDHREYLDHKSSQRVSVAVYSAEKKGMLWWKNVVIHSRWGKEQFYYWNGEFEPGGLTLEEEKKRLAARITDLTIMAKNGSAFVKVKDSALASFAALFMRFEWVSQGRSACSVCLNCPDGSSILNTSEKPVAFQIQPGTLPICTACRRDLQIQITK